MWLGTPDQIEAHYIGNPSRKVRKQTREALPERVMAPPAEDCNAFTNWFNTFEHRNAIQAMCLAIQDWLVCPDEPKPVYGTGEKTKVPSAKRRGIGLRKFVKSLTR